MISQKQPAKVATLFEGLVKRIADESSSAAPASPAQKSESCVVERDGRFVIVRNGKVHGELVLRKDHVVFTQNQNVRTLRGASSGWLTNLAVTEDGSTAAAVRDGRFLCLWSLRSGQLRKEIFLPDARLTTVVSLPGVTGFIVQGSNRSAVYYIDARTMRTTPLQHTETITWVGFAEAAGGTKTLPGQDAIIVGGTKRVSIFGLKKRDKGGHLSPTLMDRAPAAQSTSAACTSIVRLS